MTFLLCDPDWCVHKSDAQNKWDDNTNHTNTRVMEHREKSSDDKWKGSGTLQ